MNTLTRFFKWLFGLFSTEKKRLRKNAPSDFSWYVDFVAERYPDVVEYLNGKECWIVWLFLTKCKDHHRKLNSKYVSYQYMKAFYNTTDDKSFLTIKRANTGYVSRALNNLHLKGILDCTVINVHNKKYSQYNLNKKFFSAVYEQQD